jgi:hypothetical protein
VIAPRVRTREEAIKEGAAWFLEPGEQVLAAWLAPSRIVTFDLGMSEIESVEGKRFGAGGVITVTAHSGTFKLECKAPAAKAFADAFAGAKT